MTNTPLHSSNNVCTAAESLKRRSKARVAGSECMVCKCTAPAITGVAVWQLPQGTSQVGLYVQLIQAKRQVAGSRAGSTAASPEQCHDVGEQHPELQRHKAVVDE